LLLAAQGLQEPLIMLPLSAAQGLQPDVIAASLDLPLAAAQGLQAVWFIACGFAAAQGLLPANTVLDRVTPLVKRAAATPDITIDFFTVISPK
jgi:hypothetical protein